MRHPILPDENEQRYCNKAKIPWEFFSTERCMTFQRGNKKRPKLEYIGMYLMKKRFANVWAKIGNPTSVLP